MSTPATLTNRANKALHSLTRGFQDAIPVTALFAAVTDQGFVCTAPEIEAGFMLCGRKGRTTFPFSLPGTKVTRTLSLLWEKMDSGRYEVVSYLS